MGDPLATIVVTPRERYSTTERSLATIAAHTEHPYRLICVLGTAPRYVEELAKKACAEHGWDLISRSGILSPNEARNVGLERARTRYVVFVDNDVVVGPGWLEALVTCAEETGAAVVGPLVLVGEPEDGVVHSVGGTVKLADRNGRRDILERHLVRNVRLNEEHVTFERVPCDFGEFHGMLVRRDVFDRVGPLDEGVLSTAEHLDLAFQMRELGETTWSEPAAMISYLSSAVDYSLGDVDLFEVRWGEDWCERGLDHLCQKWEIARDAQYIDELALYARYLRARIPRPDVAPRPTTDDPASIVFAQTNVQLFNQLRALGTPGFELEKVRAAYDVAVSLFRGRHRPSGKTFLSHLVGTASVLAAFGWHPPVVTAGILHAAYRGGAFPALCRDDEARRRWLRRQVGRLTEEIVDQYAHLDLASVQRQIDADDLDRVPVKVAYAVVLRIANSIEEHSDGASAYSDSADVREQRARDEEAWGPIIAAIAPRIGASAMVDLSRELAKRAGEIEVPAELRYPDPRSFLVTELGTTEPLVVPTRSTPTPTVARDLTDFTAPPGPPTLTDRVARVPSRAYEAMEEGRVTWRRRTVLVDCDPRQWTYSACAVLDDVAARGPGALHLRVIVDSGELGIGVLPPDSWTDFVVPEWSHGPTADAIEVVVDLPAIEEATRIVLRSWAPTGVPTKARVLTTEVFRVPSRTA